MSLMDRVFFTEEEDWRSFYWCPVVSFEEFVTSKDHLGLLPLTGRQYEAVYDFIGKDPYKVLDPSRKKNLAVWLWGKGSGKDYVTSLLLAYVFYILLCMNDPHDFLHRPKDDNIDLINVATNSRQARRVFFNKFSKRICNWKWLLKNYRVTRKQKLVRGSIGNRMNIAITDTTIETEHNIRCNSEHSDAGGYEGYNVLFFVMDEASEFDDKFEMTMQGNEVVNIGKAQIIYDTLRTSAASRNWPWLGVVISFPRRQEDFTIRLYEQAQREPDSFMIGNRGCTWDFNPLYLGQPKFRFEQWDIPYSLKKELEVNPVDFKMKYCTVPPIVQNSFFYNPSRLKDAIDENIKPLVESVSEVQELTDASGKKIPFVIKRITASSLVDRTKAYAAHVDLSINGDTTSLVIGHGEPCQIKSTFVDEQGLSAVKTLSTRVIIDQILTWEPVNVSGNQALVSHINVNEILEQISNLAGISYISYDMFQSQYVLEKAIRDGISVEKHNIKDNDYVLLRNLVYAGAISWPNHKKLIMELERLVYDGKRINHPFDFSKDIADCVAGVARAVLSGLAKGKDRWVYSFFGDELFHPENMSKRQDTIRIRDSMSGVDLPTGIPLQQEGQDWGFLQ